MTRGEAAYLLKKDDQERRKWSLHLYGIDNTDPKIYDLVLHINKLTVADAVDIITHAANLPHLQATDESRRALEDEALAAAVKAVLVKPYPDVEVTSEDGVVFVTAKTTEAEELRMDKRIRELACVVPGVKDVQVHLRWFTPFGA